MLVRPDRPSHRLAIGIDQARIPPLREPTRSHRSERGEKASARFGRDDRLDFEAMENFGAGIGKAGDLKNDRGYRVAVMNCDRRVTSVPPNLNHPPSETEGGAPNGTEDCLGVAARGRRDWFGWRDLVGRRGSMEWRRLGRAAG